MIGTFAAALAHLNWRETHRGAPDDEPPAAVIERLANLYCDQIEANYRRPPPGTEGRAAAS